MMNRMEKLTHLRKLMKERGLQAYIVVTDDFHGSEYVGDYFKAREFLSGFTGSAGTLVVLMEETALFTDGRYFLQAEAELAGSEILLMRMGEEGVPAIPGYLREKLEGEPVVGFDARTVSNSFIKSLTDTFGEKGIRFSSEEDLVDLLWENRPSLSMEPVWEPDVKCIGYARNEKLKDIRKAMKQQHTDCLILTALDDVAWILNLRGHDVKYTPVFLSFFLLEQDKATLFVERGKVPAEIGSALERDGVTLADYEAVYAHLANIPEEKKVWFDGDSANYRITQSLKNAVNMQSPVIPLRARKTEAEMESMRRAHRKDGVAVCRFMRWLKSQAGCGVSEVEAAKKIDAFRAKEHGFLEPSFESIIAYGAHGAIVHYEPTGESDVKIEARGLCLCDTGGQYQDGTTDITRTLVMGELSEEEKKAYTLVLRGHLRLSAARFVYGVSGANLDYLARGVLWEHGMDYRHGTGHGVGFLLNVHEGPQRFAWRTNHPSACTVLEEGMVISDEPGYYEPGKFGIRHENLLLVRKGEATEYGQFLYFEPLTLVPFDRDGIDTSLLNEEDLRYLNAYHKRVYEALAPALTEDEKNWLWEYTKEIK